MTTNLEQMLGELERLAKEATPGEWRTRYGGNFTQVWELTTNMSEPSERLIADINFRKSNLGQNTPVVSRRNAKFIAAANPSAILSLIALVRSELGGCIPSNTATVTFQLGDPQHREILASVIELFHGRGLKIAPPSADTGGK